VDSFFQAISFKTTYCDEHFKKSNLQCKLQKFQNVTEMDIQIKKHLITGRIDFQCWNGLYHPRPLYHFIYVQLGSDIGRFRL
jgi:hypothetical protein